MIVEAEKSHHLSSDSWGPRKAGGEVSVQVQRFGGIDGKILVWGQDEISVPAHSVRYRGGISLLAFLFYWGPQQTGWCQPSLGRTVCFTTNSNAILSRNMLSDTPQNNVSPDIWVKKRSYIKLTIMTIPPLRYTPKYCLTRYLS